MKKLITLILVLLFWTVPTNAHASTRVTTTDVVGVWVNHHDKDIHQQITFTKDHHWRENQHHQKDIYKGTWKITGKHEITLAPYGEVIRFSKNNQVMTVINYDHVLTRNNH
ncbi:hypothetical protein [Limosilactobacillus gastricus]|uniref:hypothetical protein n=1 Tax=Limosilactobacillus gastricus TaxID=227942 RepID=UPI00058CDE9A|nr:hypothetical protein [Limosilactobacillus gastricus]